jgi:glycosyltransferase involved in cell wall biosynthesis
MGGVSVIIPTYNRAACLKLALASVLNQTYQSFEIIVVDDASTDGTPGVVRGLADARITYVRHEVNRGKVGAGAAARNSGIARARGTYIAFLDDDDEWLPEKLARQVAVLEASPRSVGAVYTGFVKIDQATGQIVERIIPTRRGTISRDLIAENCVGTPSTVLVRNECFQKVGLFDESMAFGEDYDMWIRIASEFEFDYIDEPLVRYAVHDVQLSAQNYERKISGLEAQLRKHVAFFALDPRGHSRLYLELGVLCCYDGDVRRGRAAFRQGLRIYPREIRHYFNLGLSFLGPRTFVKVKEYLARVHPPP